MAGNIKGITIEIGGETTKLQSALKSATDKGRETATELGKINKALKYDTDNLVLIAQKMDVLKDRVSATEEQLNTLKSAQEDVEKQFKNGDIGADEYRAFQREVEETENKLKNFKDQLKDTEKEFKDHSSVIGKVKDAYDDFKEKVEKLKNEHPKLTSALEKSNDAAKKLASGGLKTLAGAGATTAGAITGLVAGGVGLVDKLGEISEETKELRDNLGKLETAFTTNNLTAEQSKKSYVDLYAVLGDSDKATETATHIAAMTDSQKELSEWTDICTGVYGKFGDSLPTEALAEASNETSKTGKLTGALADALNWAGENEEKFQSKLDACSTEQERQALITETLNGLYGESAEKYREVNDTLIKAQKAQAEYSLSLAGLGDAVDKVKNEAMAKFLPGITEVVDGLNALLSGEEGAPELIKKGFEDLLSGIEEFLPCVKDILDGLTDTVVEIAPDIIISLSNGILENLDSLTSATFEIIESLCTDLLTEKNITQLTTAAIKLVLSLSQFLGNNSEIIVDAAFKLIDGLIDGLLDEKNAQKLVQSAFDIVQEITGSVIDNAPKLAAGAIQLGISLLQGLWQGIKDTKEWLKVKVAEIGENILQWCKDALGIKSPSRRAKDEIGKPFVQGIVDGIKNDKKNAEKSAGELGNVIVKSASKELETYKKYHEVTASDEAEFWKEIVEYTKEGTKGRIEAEEKYLEAVKKVKEEAVVNIQELTNAYNEAVEKRQEALLSEFSLFEAANEKSQKSKKELQKNLNSQVEALEDYSNVMASLSSRIEDEEFLAELQKMGVEATGELEALNSMTDKQLDRYVNTWKKRNTLARETAIAELEPLEEETIEEIQKIATNVALNCDGDYQNLGRELILSVSAGIENEQGTLNAAVNAAVLSAINAQQDGSHAGGIGYVPYNGYTSELHEGERILTAAENRNYNLQQQEKTAERETMSRRLDALERAINQKTVNNIHVTATGSARSVVRGLSFYIDEENTRQGVFDKK